MIVTTVLGRIVSIFIIILAGILCQKLGYIDKANEKKLSMILNNIVVPSIIFTSFQIDYDPELIKNMGIVFILGLMSYILSIILCHFMLHEREGYDLAVEKFSIVFDNIGFVGVPLASALFGNIGVIYVTVFIAVYHICCWTYGIKLMDDADFALKKLLNPALISVVFGLVFFVLQIRVPETLEFPLESIGNMNTPLAMIISGAIIGKIDMKKAIKTFKKGHIYYVVAMRLIVSSMIFCAILHFLPLDAEVRTVSAIAGSTPAGSMAITMSVLYNHDSNYAAEIFAMSTILSLISMPICIMIAG